MNPRVCVCCGEAMPEGGNALSRNPNVCSSCSSMADGMGAEGMRELGDAAGREANDPRQNYQAPEPAEVAAASR